ncbi:MAG: hypothetical protein ABI045_05990 [Flavobacteriales bacterium]
MNVNLITISESTMHNLALALHEQYVQISGSDNLIFEPSRSKLVIKKLLPDALGWFFEKITPALDAISLNMHARTNNPESQRAQSLNLKIYSYPKFFYEQFKI